MLIVAILQLETINDRCYRNTFMNRQFLRLLRDVQTVCETFFNFYGGSSHVSFTELLRQQTKSDQNSSAQRFPRNRCCYLIFFTS